MPLLARTMLALFLAFAATGSVRACDECADAPVASLAGDPSAVTFPDAHGHEDAGDCGGGAGECDDCGGTCAACPCCAGHSLHRPRAQLRPPLAWLGELRVAAPTSDSRRHVADVFQPPRA